MIEQKQFAEAKELFTTQKFSVLIKGVLNCVEAFEMRENYKFERPRTIIISLALEVVCKGVRCTKASTLSLNQIIVHVRDFIFNVTLKLFSFNVE